MAPFWLSRLSRYLICENRRRCEVDVVAVQVQRDDSGGSRAAEWVEDDTGHNVRATRACGLPAKCPGLHDGLARLALAEMGGRIESCAQLPTAQPIVIVCVRPVSYITRSHGAPQCAQHPMSLVPARMHDSTTFAGTIAKCASLEASQGMVQISPLYW